MPLQGQELEGFRAIIEFWGERLISPFTLTPQSGTKQKKKKKKKDIFPNYIVQLY